MLLAATINDAHLISSSLPNLFSKLKSWVYIRRMRTEYFFINLTAEKARDRDHIFCSLRDKHNKENSYLDFVAI